MPEEIKAAPESGAEAEAQQGTAAAETETAKTTEERIADLEARLTQRGRSETQLKTDLKALAAEREQSKKELAEAQKVNADWKKWYMDHAASEDEKAKYAVEEKATELTSAQKSAIEASHWKAIAEEENPLVKKALVASANKGEFIGKAAIEALREVLVTPKKDDEEEPDDEKKEPPQVKPTGGTRTAGPTIDQQIAEVKDGIKKGKNTVSDLLPLMQQKQELERTAARG